MIGFLAIFLAGVATEALWIVWAHFTAKRDLGGLAVCGALQGLATLVGVGGAITGLPEAITFIAGCSVGPVLGVFIQQRLSRDPPRV